MVLKKYDKEALLGATKDHKLLPLLNTVLVVKYLVSKVFSTIEIILFTDFLPYFFNFKNKTIFVKYLL